MRARQRREAEHQAGSRECRERRVPLCRSYSCRHRPHQRLWPEHSVLRCRGSQCDSRTLWSPCGRRSGDRVQKLLRQFRSRFGTVGDRCILAWLCSRCRLPDAQLPHSRSSLPAQHRPWRADHAEQQSLLEAQHTRFRSSDCADCCRCLNLARLKTRDSGGFSARQLSEQSRLP